MGQTIFRWAVMLAVVLAAFILVILSASLCSAQGVNFGNPAAPPPPTEFGPVASPLGDIWGVSEALAKSGVTVSGIYTGEVLANVNGGKQTGAIAEGLLELDLDIDLSKSIGLKGGSIHFAGF